MHLRTNFSAFFKVTSWVASPVDLREQYLATEGTRYKLAPGMQVIAEIHLGERTVLEYLLSPVQRAFHEAGRER